MLFSRACSAISHDPNEKARSKSLNYLDHTTKNGVPPAAPLSFGRFASATKSFGSALVNTALMRKKHVAHHDCFCDGCGMDPILGALWTCSVCSNYNLCTDCYAGGTHGMENTVDLHTLQEAIVQDKLHKRCKRFTPEFLLSLRRDVCKGRIDKLEYMGGWIADIVSGVVPAKITVRGIEIPHLTPAARQRFVANLMPLVSNRTDLEVHIEWLLDDSDPPPPSTTSAATNVDQAKYGQEVVQLEKLRLWISDKKTRTTSPFA